MKRNRGQMFASHFGPGWFGRAHGTFCWPSQEASQGSQDCALADVASSFLSLKRHHHTSSPRDLGGEFFPGLQLHSPLHALSTLSQQLAGQTDKPSISLLGEERETQSPPITMETKTAKKSSGTVQDFSPRPWGNLAPEKWAAVTVKITVHGRDRGSWGSQRGSGRGSATWLRCPVSHLGHEQVPALPMVGDAQLWGWERMTVPPQPYSCPRCRRMPQGGQRSWLLSFVNGCNPVVSVVAEPSACRLQPASPAPSKPTCVHSPDHPRAAQLLPKLGLCKPWQAQPGAAKRRDGATLAWANSTSVCPSHPHAGAMLCNLEKGCPGPAGDLTPCHCL